MISKLEICIFILLVGEQYVRKVEMLYCDLCHKYLPRIEPEKDIQCLLRDHCLTRGHQNAYLRKQKELLEENLNHSEQQVCRLQVCRFLSVELRETLD